MTLANQLKNDPRIAQAKKLIQDAILEKQKQVVDIKASDSSKMEAYQLLIDQLNKSRGGNIYFPYVSSGFGHGPYVELEDGSIKLDMITGIGVHYFGHLTEPYVNAHFDSIFSSTVMQGHLQQQSNTVQLLDLILKAANKNGAKLEHGVISSSGAMANENALKICFSNKENSNRVLAFEKCFHGRTMSMASITDKAAYRNGIPLSINVDYLPFYNPDHPEKSMDRCLKKLTTLLNRYPNSYSTFIMELIQGEGGFNEAPREFFIPILEKLKEHQINIWFDEIQTLGRTTEIFAFQELNLDEYVDVMTFGKMAQICGTLFKTDLKPKPGLISQTYTSSSSAIQASINTFEELLNGDLFGKEGKIIENRDHFLAHFKTLSKKHPQHFSGPFGHGGMISFCYENGDLAESQLFLKALFKNGLIAFIAGSNPVKVRFLPPMGCLNQEHINQACQILDKTITEMKG